MEILPRVTVLSMQPLSVEKAAILLSGFVENQIEHDVDGNDDIKEMPTEVLAQLKAVMRSLNNEPDIAQE